MGLVRQNSLDLQICSRIYNAAPFSTVRAVMEVGGGEGARTAGLDVTATAQVLRRRPLTVESRVQPQGSPCGICGTQSTWSFP